jgi:outer membrane receptor protein involved in Fe transport
LQDEWKLTKDFKLTYGLRVDAPSYNNSLKNPNFNGDGTLKELSGRLANNCKQRPTGFIDANGNRVSNELVKMGQQPLLENLLVIPKNWF